MRIFHCFTYFWLVACTIIFFLFTPSNSEPWKSVDTTNPYLMILSTVAKTHFQFDQICYRQFLSSTLLNSVYYRFGRQLHNRDIRPLWHDCHINYLDFWTKEHYHLSLKLYCHSNSWFRLHLQKSSYSNSSPTTI